MTTVMAGRRGGGGGGPLAVFRCLKATLVPLRVLLFVVLPSFFWLFFSAEIRLPP